MTQSHPDLSPLVALAQAGDRGALTRLLDAAQDRVMALCVGRLGNPELARDAAQDALIDAFLHINQLREPRALFSWLRLVALKHCDRHVRKRQPVPVPEVEPRDEAREGERRSVDSEERLGQAQQQSLMRAVIDELPEHERVAVALHYLAELPLREVAELLEVSANTIKQRLHSARTRLRERSERNMRDSLLAMRPSNTRGLERSVRIFLATRVGDLEETRDLLDSDPGLVQAQERWDPDDHGLPLGTHATPLVRAAERGHVDLVKLLLERGAEVDGACGCATGETPLWGAAVSAKHDCVRVLLERGANPNRAGAAGVTPLHVAAMRDDAKLLEQLLEYDADITVRDGQGCTALDWALEKNHERIVERLEGFIAVTTGDRAIAATGSRESAPPGAELDGEAAADGAPFETGIKALDLFAPMRRGMLVRVDGGARVGCKVLLAELVHAAGAQRGTESVWAFWQHEAWQDSEFGHLLAETGALRRVHQIKSAPDDTEIQRRALPTRALAEARALLEGGAEHVVLTLFEAPGYRADVRALYGELRREGSHITTLLVTPASEVGSGPDPIAPPIDARVCFDSALLARALLPAVHPLHSSGAALDGDDAQTVTDVQDLLQELRDVAPDLDPDLDVLPPEQRLRMARALRIQAYLTQPFHGTEPFVSRPGVSIRRCEALEKLRAILGGTHDDATVASLLYGSL